MRITFLFVCLMVAIGCAELTDEATNESPISYTNETSNSNSKVNIITLGTFNGRWQIIELNYKGKNYAFLRSYDGNNQALVELKE